VIDVEISPASADTQPRYDDRGLAARARTADLGS